MTENVGLKVLLTVGVKSVNETGYSNGFLQITDSCKVLEQPYVIVQCSLRQHTGLLNNLRCPLEVVAACLQPLLRHFGQWNALLNFA